MRAIRHGNPEKHGNAVDSGHAESCHGCGTALNCVPAHAAGGYQPGDGAGTPALRSAVLPVSFK